VRFIIFSSPDNYFDMIEIRWNYFAYDIQLNNLGVSRVLLSHIKNWWRLRTISSQMSVCPV